MYSQLGLCTQTDALFDNLTIKEHLLFYGKLKNIKKEDLGIKITVLLEKMKLTDAQDKLAGVLSGGNKRKLSVCIAMLGSPRLLILDGACV